MSQLAPIDMVDVSSRLYIALYIYRPGTIITMDGTVMAILGYPVFPLIMEASNPAVSAPIKAAAAAGKDKSTSVSRNVFAMAPMHPALAAIFFELLNIIENPKTPPKLVNSLKSNLVDVGMCNFTKSTG